MTRTLLALDIGGANIKAADGQGFAASQPFALWKRPDELAGALAELILAAPSAKRLAVTMTGELADCYQTKVEGVRRILESVAQAAQGLTVFVYLVTGKLAPLEDAVRLPELVAASNWHALASFACRFVGRPSQPTHSRQPTRSPQNSRSCGLLLDVGSTTADIVPISSRRPLTSSQSDVERLTRRELVYTGVRRSPVCGVVTALPWQGGACPVAQEVFATTADAYVLLGELPEDGSDTATADGRPLTRIHAHARLARMICLDQSSFSPTDAACAAEAVRDAQLELLASALCQVVAAMPRRPDIVIVSGEGEFLARRLLSNLAMAVPVTSLAETLGTEASRAAPAHALAVLAAEQGRGGE